MQKVSLVKPVVLACLTAMFLGVGPFARAADDTIDFNGFPAWLKGLKNEARRMGMPEGMLEVAFDGVKPDPKIIKLDRRQAEFTENIWTYLDKRVGSMTVGKGRRLYQQHRQLLDKIEKTYGVPGKYVIAFWGLETRYGAIHGDYRLTEALATLAYDKRRGKFFRGQLLALLKLINAGDLPVDAKGSWAGAMGNMQFIPTTYLAYAVDFDGDGRRDLWNSLPDSFASAANYLRAAGWKSDQTWGREVLLPKNMKLSLIGLKKKRQLAQWSKLGVTKADGSPLPKVKVAGAIILPSGIKGPAFMIYDNFNVILDWNRAQLYAIAVGHLADRIIGGGNLKTKRDKSIVTFSRGEIIRVQRTLAALGYEVGEADGVIGPQTREALGLYQQKNSLPADGHLDKVTMNKIFTEKPADALAR